MNKNCGIVKCICETCDNQIECKYFDSVIYPIVIRVCSPIQLDSFTTKIIDVLESFTCEEYEN